MSLLALHLPMAGLGLTMPKSGNAHPIFSPVGVYKTADGFVSIAVGNDAQWQAIVKSEGFESLDKADYSTNNQRKTNEMQMNKELGKILSTKNTSEVLTLFRGERIPISKVSLIKDVLKDSYLNGKSLHVKDPKSGLEVPLAPPPVAQEDEAKLIFPPRHGEHNDEIFSQLGYDVGELKENGVI